MSKEKNKGLRYNEGKAQWSLVDFDALLPMVQVLEFGAEKYSADNWKGGLKTTEIIESMLRHVYAYLRGEDVDLESGLPHTGHIMCNAMFLSYMHEFRKDYDTRRSDVKKQIGMVKLNLKSVKPITQDYATGGELTSCNCKVVEVCRGEVGFNPDLPIRPE